MCILTVPVMSWSHVRLFRPQMEIVHPSFCFNLSPFILVMQWLFSHSDSSFLHSLSVTDFKLSDLSSFSKPYMETLFQQPVGLLIAVHVCMPRTVDPCEPTAWECDNVRLLPAKHTFVNLTWHALVVCHYDSTVYLLFIQPSYCSTGGFDFHPELQVEMSYQES